MEPAEQVKELVKYLTDLEYVFEHDDCQCVDDDAWNKGEDEGGWDQAEYDDPDNHAGYCPYYLAADIDKTLRRLGLREEGDDA